MDKMQKIVEYTIQRINALLEQIDDSTEQRSGCLSHLHKLYAMILEQTPYRDDTKAKRFYHFWLNDRFDLLGIQASDWLSLGAKQKFNNLVKEQWASEQKAGSQATLKNWQKVKLARYLFEEAIQSHDNLRANEYRRFFSKD